MAGILFYCFINILLVLYLRKYLIIMQPLLCCTELWNIYLSFLLMSNVFNRRDKCNNTMQNHEGYIISHNAVHLTSYVKESPHNLQSAQSTSFKKLHSHISELRLFPDQRILYPLDFEQLPLYVLHSDGGVSHGHHILFSCDEQHMNYEHVSCQAQCITLI